MRKQANKSKPTRAARKKLSPINFGEFAILSNSAFVVKLS